MEMGIETVADGKTTLKSFVCYPLSENTVKVGTIMYSQEQGAFVSAFAPCTSRCRMDLLHMLLPKVPSTVSL